MRNLLLFTLLFTTSLTAWAYDAEQLEGSWCFYEQEGSGNIVEEKVTIVLSQDGTYTWSDVFWKQNGKWSVSEDKLIMSDVGSHSLVAVTADKVEMTRGSTMRMRKGVCE